MIGWTIFHNPILLPFSSLLWLLVPLCVSVAVIYKTVRTNHLRHLGREIAYLVIYMLAGLVVLGAGLCLIQQYWP